MLKGINLTLLIGPAVPIPAPKIVLEALTTIQVTNNTDRSGFQLGFNAAKNSPIFTTMLPAGFFDPISTRVIIVVTLNGIPNVIMDGLVTNHEISPSNEPGQFTLTLTGEDLSLAMDLITHIIPYPAMPEVAMVYKALAPYAVLGITPLVIPTVIPVQKPPTEDWETQISTDRTFIKFLAEKNGYIFFVRPGPLPGQSIAYFGPDVNLPIPQRALSINFDNSSNVESISFSLDGLAKKVRIYTIYDPITRKIPLPVPVPNINLLKPPLGIRPTPPAKVEFRKDFAKLNMPEASQGVLSFLLNNAKAAVTANGSLDVMRYKGLLRSRMLVGVRGAGLTYDGLYYVDSVTHDIKKGEYKQNFTLSRDGVVSNTPNVLV